MMKAPPPKQATLCEAKTPPQTNASYSAPSTHIHFCTPHRKPPPPQPRPKPSPLAKEFAPTAPVELPPNPSSTMEKVQRMFSAAEDLIERDPNSDKIVDLFEMKVAEALMAGHHDLLAHMYSQGPECQPSSLLDLAVRFGYNDIASRLAHSGVQLKSLTMADLVGPRCPMPGGQFGHIKPKPFRAAFAAGLASSQTALFLKNLKTSIEVDHDNSGAFSTSQGHESKSDDAEASHESRSLLDVAIANGQPHSASAMVKLGVSCLPPYGWMKDFLSWGRDWRQGGTYPALYVNWHALLAAICAGVDDGAFTMLIEADVGLVPPKNLHVSVLDAVFADYNNLDRTLKRQPICGLIHATAVAQWLCSMGAKSSQGSWIGTFMLEQRPTTRHVDLSLPMFDMALEPRVGLQIVKSALSIGIDIRQLKVDLALAKRLGFQIELPPFDCLDSITLLGMAVLCGQPDVAAHLASHGCEHNDLVMAHLDTTRERNNRFRQHVIGPFDRMVAAKAALQGVCHSYIFSQLARQWGSNHSTMDDHVIDVILEYSRPLPKLSALDFRLPFPPPVIAKIAVFAIPQTFNSPPPIFKSPPGPPPTTLILQQQTVRIKSPPSLPPPTVHQQHVLREAEPILPDAEEDASIVIRADSTGGEDAQVMQGLEDSSVESGDEPVAQIDPTEAAQISEERWASWVQHHATDLLLPSEAQEGNPTRGGITILSFSRHPSQLEEAIMQSDLALKAEAEGVDVQPTWANGAKILTSQVSPKDFDQDLGPYQVVVKEEDEEALNEALLCLPYRFRKLKPGMPRTSLPGHLSLLEVSSNDVSNDSEISTPQPTSESDGVSVVGEEITVIRTFIHFQSRVQASASAHTW